VTARRQLEQTVSGDEQAVLLLARPVSPKEADEARVELRGRLDQTSPFAAELDRRGGAGAAETPQAAAIEPAAPDPQAAEQLRELLLLEEGLVSKQADWEAQLRRADAGAPDLISLL
jgi:hypothetical protein